MDKYYVYRPLLDLIGFTEGTDKGRGYNETLGYGAYTGGDVELVKMTLTEIDALQTKMLANKKNKLKSSALGRYQVIRTTLRTIRKTLDLSPTLLFDKDMQDRIGCYLLGVRGVDKYIGGRLSEDTLINNLAKEWASLPTTAGKGAYAGQHTPITAAKVREVLAEVRKRASTPAPEAVVVPVAQAEPEPAAQTVVPATPAKSPVVVTTPVTSPPPATVTMPKTRKGLGVLAAILAAIVAAFARFHFGG